MVKRMEDEMRDEWASRDGGQVPGHHRGSSIYSDDSLLCSAYHQQRSLDPHGAALAYEAYEDSAYDSQTGGDSDLSEGKTAG